MAKSEVAWFVKETIENYTQNLQFIAFNDGRTTGTDPAEYDVD